MLCYCIATLRESNNAIYGFRIADIDSMAKQPDGKVIMKTIDVPYDKVDQQLRVNNNAIRNLKIEANLVSGAEGALGRYPMVYRDGKVKEAIVIIKESNDNVICCNSTGHCAMYPEKKIVELSKHIQIANGKIVNERLAELVANTFKSEQTEKPKETKQVNQAKQVNDVKPKQKISETDVSEAQALQQKINQLMQMKQASNNIQQAQVKSKFTWLSDTIYGNEDIELEIITRTLGDKKLAYLHHITLYNNIYELVIPSFITNIEQLTYKVAEPGLCINKLSIKHKVRLSTDSFSCIANIDNSKPHLIKELNIELPKEAMIDKTDDNYNLERFSVNKFTTNSLYRLYDCTFDEIDISKAKPYKIDFWLLAVNVNKLIMPSKSVALEKAWIQQGHIGTLVLNGNTTFNELDSSKEIRFGMSHNSYSIDPYIENIENQQYIKKVYINGLKPYVGKKLELGDVEVEGRMLGRDSYRQGDAPRLLNEVHINSLKTFSRKRNKYISTYTDGRLTFPADFKNNQTFDIYLGKGNFDLCASDINTSYKHERIMYHVYWNSPAYRKLIELGVNKENIIIVDEENIPEEVKRAEAKIKIFGISPVDSFLALLKEYTVQADNIRSLRTRNYNIRDEAVSSIDALREIEADKTSWETFEFNSGKGYEIGQDHIYEIIPNREKTIWATNVSKQQFNDMVNTMKNNLQSCIELFSPSLLPKLLNVVSIDASYASTSTSYRVLNITSETSYEYKVQCGNSSIYAISLTIMHNEIEGKKILQEYTTDNENRINIIIVRTNDRVEEAFILEKTQSIYFRLDNGVEQESIERVLNDNFIYNKDADSLTVDIETKMINYQTDSNAVNNLDSLYTNLRATSNFCIQYSVTNNDIQCTNLYEATGNQEVTLCADGKSTYKSIDSNEAKDEIKRLSVEAYAELLKFIKENGKDGLIKEATPCKLWLNAKKYQNELEDLSTRPIDASGLHATKDYDWYKIISDLMNNEYYTEKDSKFYDKIVKDKNHKGFRLDRDIDTLKFPDGTALRVKRTSGRGFLPKGVAYTGNQLDTLIILENNAYGIKPRYFIGEKSIRNVLKIIKDIAEHLRNQYSNSLNLETALTNYCYSMLDYDNNNWSNNGYYMINYRDGYFCGFNSSVTDVRKIKEDKKTSARVMIIMDYNTGIVYMAIHIGFKYKPSIHSEEIKRDVIIPLLRLNSLYSGYEILKREESQSLSSIYFGIAVGITAMLKEDSTITQADFFTTYEHCRDIHKDFWANSDIEKIMHAQYDINSLQYEMRDRYRANKAIGRFILTHYGYLKK